MTAAVSGAPLWLAVVMVAVGGVGAVLDARRHERRNGKERTMSEPDEAAVEAVAQAILHAEIAARGSEGGLNPRLRAAARAVLATPVVADAVRDAETLAKVREIVDEWEDGGDVPAPDGPAFVGPFARIAALLAVES